MTNQLFDPEQFNSIGVNLYGSAIATSAQERFEPATFTDITNLLRNAGMKLDRDVRVTAIRITDLRNGWGQSDDQIKTSASTAWQEYRRQLTLPPLITQTQVGSGTNVAGLFHCWYGTSRILVFGGGSTTLRPMFMETSATNPVPTNLAFTLVGGGNLSSLSAAVLNSTDERVIMGSETGVGQYMSADLSTATPMHANTTGLWASGRTNINATTPGLGGNLLYAGTSVYYLAENAAIAGAPTQTLSGVPGGGAFIGIDALQKQWQNRMYMWWPTETRTTSGVINNVPGYVVSINLEGTGVERVPTTLSRCYFAFLSNRTVVMSDGVRLVAFDGETERDLHILKGRASNSDYRWGVSGGFDHEGMIYAFVVRFDLTVAANSLGSTVLTLEHYSPELDSWQPVTGNWPLINVAGSSAREMIYGPVDLVHANAMSMPYSKQTGFVHINCRDANINWDRTWLPPGGINPFLHYNKTGTNNEISQQWATSAQWTSDKFPIRGLPPGSKHVWLGCSASEMDLAAGGVGPTAANVAMSCAIQDGTTHTFTGAKSETFTASDPLDKLTRWWLDNTSDFTIGQVRLDLTQDTSVTYKTPNALPATFYVMSFLTGKVRAPYQAGFEPFDHAEGASW